jgi:hypothetical protein
MQFIDRTKTVIVLANLFVAMSLIVVNAGTQLDIGGAVISGQNNNSPDAVSSATKQNKTAGNAYVNYLGVYSFSPVWQFLVSENYDGIYPFNNKRDSVSGKLAPLPERNVLSSNNVSLGLGFTGFGNAQVIVRNLWYIDTMSIYPDLAPRAFARVENVDSLTSDSIENGLLYFDRLQLIRTSRSNASLYYQFPVGSAEIIADVNYFFLNYINPVRMSNESVFDSVISRNKYTDIDQYVNLLLKYNLPLDFNVMLGTHLKHNLSGHSFTNLYQYELMAGGDHSFPLSNKLTWNAGAQWLGRAKASSMPEEYRSYMEGKYAIPRQLTYSYYVRDVYTLAWGVFVKATAIGDFSKDLYKQRYELALRKAWENSSYIDGGYFTAIGGLFPMRGSYLRARYCPVPSLAFTGATKFLWQQTTIYDDTGAIASYKFKYLKNVSTAEIALKLFRDVALIGGAEYMYFNRNSGAGYDSPARFSGYIGIKGTL